MNFDFSDEQKQIKDQARKFLSEKCTTKNVRKIYEGGERFDAALWKQIAEHYRALPDTVAFELLNEPNKKLDATNWNERS